MAGLDEKQLGVFLKSLGIDAVLDDHGSLSYSLNLADGEGGSRITRARYDHHRQYWIRESSQHQYASSAPATLMAQRQWWDVLLPNNSHTDLLVRNDWSSTAIGPIESWPASLCSYTSMCLLESLAAVLLWGKDRVTIYNEAAIPLLGTRHPSLIGGRLAEHWSDISAELNPSLVEIEQTGTGKMLQNFLIPLSRHGFKEETWWDCDLVPLREDNGSIGGILVTWFEITRQVISERFSRIVNEVGNTVNEGDRDVWQHVHKVFKNFPDDISMCMLYSASNYDSGNYKLKLESAIGIRTGHPAVSPLLDLGNDSHGFALILRGALETPDQFVICDTTLATFPEAILQSINWQGYGEQPKYIAIVPVVVFNDLLKGFVIIGLNPRIAMDVNHHQFLSALSRQLGALLTTVTNAEQAKHREEKLIEDLAATEKRIRKMAELAPMGMYDLSAEGQLLWANNHFFDILGAKGAQKNFKTFSWGDFIHPDDHEAANIKMASSVIEQKTISDSLRLRRTWCSPDINGDEQTTCSEVPVWILYQAYPHIQDGKVESIMGCITDISQFKWAESVQARSADAARAAKQRLEDFIDITSHEMRNPLSAVTQCADDILGSVKDAQRLLGNDQAILEELYQIADTTKSIALCATHQRRIIDDVLTLSKLDSALLSVVPVPSRPDAIVSDAMRMFSAEFASSGIQVEIIDETPDVFVARQAAYCDSARLMQVLVNLITNAIKFTRAEDTREVVITYGATEQPPMESKYGPNFAWSTTSRKRRDLSSDARYGEGQTVYLTFSVRDTGQGLPKNEAVHIFDKFIQANRRTYIKYGGSGLGLFISRELIELQGGRIGVSSETGKGSTFAFYVKAKRSTGLRDSPGSADGVTTIQGEDYQQSNAAISYPGQPGTADAGLDVAMAGLSSASLMKEQRTAKTISYNLLLVEDNLINQKVLAKQLRKAGFSVVIANHGGEAVDRLLHIAGRDAEYASSTRAGSHPIPFDCILMDWEMPVLDGLSATRRIRELEAEGVIRPRQIIIGVTANARIEQIEMAEAAGMDEIVVKPFRVPDLIQRIAKATGTGRRPAI